MPFKVISRQSLCLYLYLGIKMTKCLILGAPKYQFSSRKLTQQPYHMLRQLSFVIGHLHLLTCQFVFAT